MSTDGGSSWSGYWQGYFWKTDCEFDLDAQTASVTPEASDVYTDILNGYEKEYDLIQLAPEIQPVWIQKRPLLQVYTPGDSVMGCFLGNMWWEQECTPESNKTNLVSQYHFTTAKRIRKIEISGEISPSLPLAITEDIPLSDNGTFDIEQGGFRFRAYIITISGVTYRTWAIIRLSDNITLWGVSYQGSFMPSMPYSVTLNPRTGTDAEGYVTLNVSQIDIYSRLLTDVNASGSYALDSATDIGGENLNYTRIYPYAASHIEACSLLTSTPTKWGLYQPGQYYQEPSHSPLYAYYPVARRSWSSISLWCSLRQEDRDVEKLWRKPYELKDAYPLWSAISVLLGQIAPSVSFANTSVYSQFLSDASNPITGIYQNVLIAPKSNIKASGYDQPAQKAPITLKQIFDMLRDCFRCYWFIDSSNRLRIEHISWFMKGGTYSGTPSVGIDLTTEALSRSGKTWAFGRNQYQFEKPQMPARYQFGWMDDVTDVFNGFPLEIVSPYVKQDEIEQVSVSRFTSDIDYILLEPSEISSEGFALLLAVPRESALAGLTASTNAGGDRFLAPDMPIPQDLWGKQVKITLRAKGTANGTLNARIAGTDVDEYPGIYITLIDANTWVNVTETITIPVGQADDMVLQWYFNTGVTFGDTQLQILSASVIGEYELPVGALTIGELDYFLQNKYAAFAYLQNYYLYDLPAPNAVMNGEAITAIGTKRLRTQTLKFPAPTDPDTSALVKTGLGNGAIEKLSITLLSRIAQATLRHDTEQ